MNFEKKCTIMQDPHNQDIEHFEPKNFPWQLKYQVISYLSTTAPGYR